MVLLLCDLSFVAFQVVGASLVDVAVAAGLQPSKGAARRLIKVHMRKRRLLSFILRIGRPYRQQQPDEIFYVLLHVFVGQWTIFSTIVAT